MKSTQKLSFKIPLLFAFLAVGFLIFSVFIFSKNKDQISFHEKIKNTQQVAFENLINKALNILKMNDELKASIVKEKRSIAVDRYNKIANDYNALNQEINSSTFFNDNMDLKKLFI